MANSDDEVKDMLHLLDEKDLHPILFTHKINNIWCIFDRIFFIQIDIMGGVGTWGGGGEEVREWAGGGGGEVDVTCGIFTGWLIFHSIFKIMILEILTI